MIFNKGTKMNIIAINNQQLYEGILDKEQDINIGDTFFHESHKYLKLTNVKNGVLICEEK